LNRLKKIRLLKKLKTSANEIKVRSSSDPVFKTWKNTVERTLNKVFGVDSQEVKQFDNLVFFYRAMIMTIGSDYSADHRRCFDRDMQILLSSIDEYIAELEEDEEDDSELSSVQKRAVGALEKVFISHSSKDCAIVEELVELLEVVGLESNQIFCTSLPGYDIDLGDNVLVLFVVSSNFYQSPVCLCEMGATWALSKDHIPIVVPPFTFEEVKGVFPLTQGLIITDPLRLNALRERLIVDF